jgi:hypothetical protein
MKLAALLTEDRLKRLRERRGECVDCGKTKKNCECFGKKFLNAIPTLDGVATIAEFATKSAGVLKKGPDGMHLDFIKTLMKERKWKKDPNDLASHPRAEHFKMDTAEIRTAAVSPLIRASNTESPSNGHDVQVPLTQNPFRMTVNPAEGDAANASEYENGYQFCQGLGHTGLNSASPEQWDSWSSREQAWRDGFAAAADTLGVPNVAEQLDATSKTALQRSMNYLAGGAGFGIGSDLAARNSLSGLGVNDLPEEQLAPIRGRGRAMGALGAGILGTIGALGMAGMEHSPGEWLDYPGDTIKNFSTGATLGLLGGFVPPAIYGHMKTKEMLDEEARKRNLEARNASRHADNSANSPVTTHPTTGSAPQTMAS